MKQKANWSPIDILPPSWWKIILVIVPGLCALWIERTSFARTDYGGQGFFVAVFVSAALIRIALSKEHRLPPWSWSVFGMLLWSLWRFVNWALNDRGMLFIINFLTRPIQRVLGVDRIELMLYSITAILIIGGAWGTYWIYKHFEGRWFRRGRIYLSFLLIVVVATALYTNSEEARANCFGVAFLSQGLHCHLRANLGLIGTIWITLVLLLLPVTFALQLAKTYGPQASLLVVAFEPAWIEMLFNPAQILGALYFKLLRAPPVDTSLYPSLDAAINIVNVLPIVSFLLIIPAGLLLFRSGKLQLWWSVLLSAITFAAILAVLIQTLDLVRTVFEYSPLAYAMFGVFIIQSWIPLLMVAVVGYKSQNLPGLPVETPQIAG